MVERLVPRDAGQYTNTNPEYVTPREYTELQSPASGRTAEEMQNELYIKWLRIGAVQPEPPATVHMPEHDPTYVAEQLRAKANLHESKNKEYGDAYMGFGDSLFSMLGNAQIDTSSPEQLARLATFILLAGKLHRYGLNFVKGGHEDSLDDMAVYAMMLKRLDLLAKPRQPAPG